MRRTVLALVVLAAMAPVGRTENLTLDLLHLVRVSERIVVGRVTKVHEIDLPGKPRVAEVEVLRRVFGPEGKRIFVLASGTWACDESHAEEGERALFFLRRLTPRDAELADPKWVKAPEFSLEVDRLRGEAPFRCIAWAGWGRMPIREFGEEEFATTRLEQLRAPHTIPSIPWPSPRFSSDRAVPLAALIAYVESLVRIPAEGPLRELVVGSPARRLKAVEAAKLVGGKKALAAAAVASIDWTDQDVWRAARDLWDLVPDRDSGLLQLGRHALPLVREGAAIALAHGLEHVSNDLVAAFEAEDVAVRRLAVAAFEWCAFLGDIGDVTPVAGALGDEDETVRARALRAIAIAATHNGDLEERADQVLLAAARDSSPTVRRIALGAFGYWPRWCNRKEVPGRIETAVLSAPDDKDLWVRRTAAESLSHLATAASEKVLRTRPVDADPLIRGYILAARGKAGAVKPLAAALMDKDPWIRRCATLGLARTGKAETLAPLTRALSDPDVDVRHLAIEGLAGMDGPAAIAALEKALDDADEVVRIVAREAVREMKARQEDDE
jgi:HEAT repeat protein